MMRQTRKVGAWRWIGLAGLAVSAAGLGMAPESEPASVGRAVVPSDQAGMVPGGGFGPRGTARFMNWETPHVHPIERTPDGTRLLVVNTADARLEVLDAAGGLGALRSISVGLDPVSVRARTASEAWVVNHLSDSVSIVNLDTGEVERTLRVSDEPGDVVFAGGKAFVTCATAHEVHVFNLADLDAAATIITLEGNSPRSMGVSPDGSTVYVAMFESGNGTTIVAGGSDGMGTIAFPPNAVSDPLGPYGGVNPPPNDGAGFEPPLNPGAGTPPRVGIIVKKQSDGRWLDDNSGDWTGLVSGANASRSGRQPGWDLIDHDVAAINAGNLAVTYTGGMLNLCMSLGVNPASGAVAVVGTDALNHIRFEPVLKGRFLRVNMATMAGGGGGVSVRDLNPHLDYATTSVDPAVRHQSIGDPRAVVFNAAGTRAYIAGMGSNNVIQVDTATGAVLGRVTVPEGPTGLALDEGRGVLHVMSKFAAVVTTLDVSGGVLGAAVESRVMFDPTPESIRTGRKHLYDTHRNSGLGHLSCASCHVDGKMDRLAWDLGDPAGNVEPLTGNNLGQGLPGLNPATANPGFEPFHPMKGPMTTQTMQDIIGHEPHHWRGDRRGLEAFAPAFMGLQGNETTLTNEEMQEFERFLATIAYPPNPYRNLDNTLPTSLPLTGHFRTGRFGNAGAPLPNGSATRGLGIYRSTARRLDNGAFACVTCHTLPTGAGTDFTLVGGTYQRVPLGPMGERHLSLVSVDGSTNHAIKVPQFRNAYKKVGFNTTQLRNTLGFGYLHDGSVDSLERFIAEPVFRVNSDQEIADLTALVLSVTGSELPQGSVSNPLEPPGQPSLDTPTAVGTQVTLRSGTPTAGQQTILNTLLTLANANKIGLIAKQPEGANAGYAYTGASVWQSDTAGVTATQATLIGGGSAASPLTITAVPFGAQTRLGVDRDDDGWFDADETRVCSDPANAAVYPGGPGSIDANADLFVDFFDYDAFVAAFEGGGTLADFNGDGFIDFFDYDGFVAAFEAGC
jgi:DNA-binding beta-propeller fold protein YncE